MSTRNLRLLTLFTLIAIGLFALWLRPAFADAPIPHVEPSQMIEQAWEKAQNSGAYSYRAHVDQVTYPAPKIVNAGRSPQQERFALEGTIDQDSDTMGMTFWPDASFNPHSGLEIKIEGNRAYGRQGQGEWEEIDNVANSFAPGNDPLGFLAGVTNIQATGLETIDFAEADVQLVYDHYTFDFDGAAFANYVRDEIEQSMREQEGLPDHVTLEAPAVYKQTTGSGEIWLNEQGLPARLRVALDLGKQENGERIQATITTDYSDYDLSRIEAAGTAVWQSPSVWMQHQAAHNDLIANALLAITLLTMGIVAAFVVLHYRHTRLFQTVVVSGIVIVMMVSPLLQAGQAHAYNQRQYERVQSSLAAAADPVAEAQAALESNQWNPHQNPLETAKATVANERLFNSAQSLAALQNTNEEALTTDSDGDGLDDADEAFWQTCDRLDLSGTYCDGVADATDSDGDGLSDGDEVYGLATHPALADTDGDFIADNLEVAGFSFNGKDWYLNPSEVDSNKDGIADGLECRIWNEDDPSYDPNGICEDSDSDGLPDVYDHDNDGDGVEDIVDLSPNNVVDAIFDRENPLDLAIEGYQVDHPLLVELQLRPTESKHLTYNGHVLDWPTGDDQGQIQRRLDTTFATTTNLDVRSPDFRSPNGDVRIVPILEILMPYSDDHYSNLPILDVAPADQTRGLLTDKWLDTTELDMFAIQVTDVGDGSGDVMAYVPLSLATSQIEDKAQAFSASMYYQPTQANWGRAHQVRLLWMVQMLTDECTLYDGDDPDSGTEDTCLAREDRLQVVHIYQDESWELTGLSVSEQHGLDMAVVYEDPAVDDNLNVDDNLYLTSWNMGQTWSTGRDCDETAVNAGCSATPDGVRDVTLANLQTTINDQWFADTNTNYIQVDLSSYPHQSHLLMASGAKADDILANVFQNVAEETNPTLLFASENSTRSINYENSQNVTVTNNQMRVSMAGAPEIVSTHMRWVTYNYAAGWAVFPVIGDEGSYLDHLIDSVVLEESDNFFNDPSDSDETVAGKRLALQFYYMSLFLGVSGVAAIDGSPPFPSSTDDSIDNTLVQNSELNATLYNTRLVLTRVLSSAVDATSFSQFGKNLIGNTTYQFRANTNNYAKKTAASKVVAGVDLGFFVLTSAFLIYAAYDESEAELAEALALASFTFSVALEGVTTLRNMPSTSPGGQFKGAAVGFALELAVIWGTFFALAAMETGFSGVGFKLLLANAIAQTIFAYIMFVLSVAIPYGGLFVAMLYLVDAWIIFATDSRISVQAIVTELIANTIYEADTIIRNMDSPNRLGFDHENSQLIDYKLGFTPQNGIIESYRIFSFLDVDADDEADAKRPTFRYHLEFSEQDHHQNLSQNQMPSEWDVTPTQVDTISGDADRYSVSLQEVIPITIPFSSTETGLNRRFDLYLNEAFALPWYECWGNFYDVHVDCEWHSKKGSTHISFPLHYDILPETLSEFVALDWNHTNNKPFPTQIDLDGDGLIKKQGDPNDSLWDTDGDGLGDLFERTYGTNPRKADTDGDGLTDKEELAYGTNAQLKDSDGDGLSDHAELIQGWIIDYGAGITRVWSNPNQVDSDGDTLTDRVEAVLGLSPNAPTDPSVAQGFAQIENFAVNELETPVALLRFDETVVNDLFHDDSGRGNTAVCITPASCPSENQNGRYGNALRFDGLDDGLLIVDSEDINLGTRAEHTISVWFQVDDASLGTEQLVYEQGGVTRGLNLYVHNNLLYANGWNTPADESAWSGNLLLTPVESGKWHHAVLVLDGAETVEDGALTLYLDGQFVGSVAGSQLWNSSGDIGVGNVQGATKFKNGDASGSVYPFGGLIDELVIFNDAKDSNEVLDLYYGRYNINDLALQTDQTISYQATVTNTHPLQDLGGFVQVGSQFFDTAPPLSILSFDRDQVVVKFLSSFPTGGERIQFTDLYCYTTSCPQIGAQAGDATGLSFEHSTVHLPTMFTHLADATTYWEPISVRFRVEDVIQLPGPGQRAYILDTAVEADGALDIYINDAGLLIQDVYGQAPATLADVAASLGNWINITIQNDTTVKFVGAGTLGNNIAGDAPFKGFIDRFSVGYPRATFNEEEISNIFYIDSATGTDSAFCPDENACPTIKFNDAPFGERVEFNGIGEYIQLENEARYDLNQLTVAAWVKFQADNTITEAIVSKGNAAWGLVSANTEGKLSFHTSGLSNEDLSSSANLGDNKWHHVVGVYDGENKYLYVDGVLDKWVAVTGQLNTNNQPVLIGANPSRNNSGLNGSIDEVVIIPAGINKTQVQALMAGAYTGIATHSPVETFTVSPEVALTLSGVASTEASTSSGVYELDQAVTAILQGSPTVNDALETGNAELIHYYAFDDSVGTTEFHNSVAGSSDIFNLTCLNTDACPAAGVTGVFGKAIYFDGIDDHMRLDVDTSSSNTTSRSISVWLKADQGTIIDYSWYGRTNEYGGVIAFDYTVPGGYSELEELWDTLDYDIPKNEWAHLAVVVEDDSTVQVYLNGELVNTGVDQGAGLTAQDFLLIGTNRFLQDRLHGYLDELRVYDGALTADEVVDLYAQSRPKLHFSFDEDNHEAVFTDSSVNQARGIPSAQACTNLTLDTISVNGFAANSSLVYIALDGQQIGYYPLVAPTTDELNITTPLCGQQLLEVSVATTDGNSSSLGSVTMDSGNVTADPQAFSHNFATGSDSFTLAGVVDNTVYFAPNPVPGTNGRLGNVARFDGNGYITISDDTILDAVINDTFTMMAWINPVNLNAPQMILGTDSSGTGLGFGFGLFGTELLVHGNGGGTIDSEPNLVIGNGWQHIAVVVNRESGLVEFYSNGQLHSTVALANVSLTPNLGDPYLIGAHRSQGQLGQAFEGQIDEFSVYSHALAASTIDTIFVQELRTYRDQGRAYLTIDAEAPAIEFSLGDPYLAPGFQQFVVSTVDNWTSVSLLDFGLKVPGSTEFVWAGAPRCLEAVVSGAAWCPSFDSTPLTNWEGAYEMQFRAVDAVGNESFSEVYTVYVDGTVPVVDSGYMGGWETAVPVAEADLTWSVSLSGSLSDPNLADGNPGSGIPTETEFSTSSVFVNLTDELGAALGAQAATVNGTTWSIDYLIENRSPTGLYTITVEAYDNVQNGSASYPAGTIRLDTRAPRAEMNPTLDLSVDVVTSTMSLITETITLNGLVSDQPQWGREVAKYHFEEAAGATLFTDYSGFGHHADCTNCPSSTTGVFGQALDFAGTGQTIKVDTIDSLNIGPELTLAAWVNPDVIPANDNARFVTYGDGKAVLRISNGRLNFYMRLDGELHHIRVEDVLVNGEYQHVAGTYDGQTMRLYHNGFLVGTLEIVGEVDDSSSLTINSAGAPFDGQIDEVILFERALSANQLFALAQKDVYGVNSMEISLAAYDFATQTSAAETWQPATLADAAGASLTGWSYDLAGDREGFYDIKTRITDTAGNVDSGRVLWSRGMIDTIAPHVELTALYNNTEPPTTEFTFTASDLALDMSTLSHPCGAEDLNMTVFSQAGHPLDGVVQEVSATCQVAGHVVETTTVSVCDAAGHCGSAATDQIITAPVAVWPFAEGNGATTADATGNFADGTLFGNATWVTETLLAAGTALDFENTGGGGAVQLPFMMNPASGPFSASIWFNADSPSSNTGYMIFQKDGSGTGRSWVHISGDGFLKSGLGSADLTGTTPLVAGEWYMATIVYDGAELFLYLDDQLENSTAATMEAADGGVVIGHHKTLNFSPFGGILDEVRFYDKALTLDEIEVLYINTAPPVAVWPFDEGNGATTADATGNFADGTLVGNATWVTDTPFAAGTALDFENTGSGDAVQLPFMLNPANGSFSASIWFNADTDSNTKYMIFQKDGSGTGRSWVHINDNGYLKSGLGSADLTGTTPLVAGEWHMATIVYDGTELFLYLDDQLENSTAATMEAADGDMVIGHHKALNFNPFKGMLDEVHFYDKALTLDQIKALYDAGNSGNGLGGTAVSNNLNLPLIGLALAIVLGLAGLAWFRPWRRRYQSG